MVWGRGGVQGGDDGGGGDGDGGDRWRRGVRRSGGENRRTH